MSGNAFIQENRQTSVTPPFVLATVKESFGAEGVTLFVSGESISTQKKYKSLKGVEAKAGDRVLCVKISGSYTVVGIL